MGESVSEEQVPSAPEIASNHDCRAMDPSLPAKASLMSVPPESAAPQKKDTQSTSVVAVEVRIPHSLLSIQHGRHVNSKQSLDIGFDFGMIAYHLLIKT